MHRLSRFISPLVLICCAISAHADEPLILSNQRGAELQFVATADGWQPARLKTPDQPDGISVTEGVLKFAARNELDEISGGWQQVDAAAGTLAFECDAPRSGLRVRRIFSFDGVASVLRIETWLRSLDEAKLLQRVGLLQWQLAGETFQTTGASPASFPVFGEKFFAGVEDVCGESRAEGDLVRLWQTPDLSVGPEWQRIASAVVGWQVPRAAPWLPGESRIREAFLQYLDPIRVMPAGINLHSDTWWTLPCPFSEADVLADIAALRRGFFERTGMFFNTYALDLGWSDPHSVWQIDANGFPNGFGLANERLNELGCRLGLWMSPSSGYAPGLDNRWLEANGYEVTKLSDEDLVACFALGGRYQREFTERVVGYARDYGLGHVIFDGLVPSCDDSSHLHGTGTASVYSIAAGFKDVMDRLRQQNPGIILEPLSCGHPPSPWWNTHSPFLLGPAGDDVPFGRVPCPDWTESLITARDVAYRAGQDKFLVRTNALETFDIIRQSPGRFQSMAAMAAGRGRWFMSANIRPELMAPTDWDFLAALVRWQRANKAFLGDARQIGGAPGRREAYGYIFHNADKDIYCIRNPWIEPRTIDLPVRVTEIRDLRTIYPRRQLAGRVGPGTEIQRIVLGPYETIFLETVAATDQPLPDEPVTPVAELIASAPEIDQGAANASSPRLDYYWSGSLTVPDVENAELCVLVEGAASVTQSSIGSWDSAGELIFERATSAGQFGAAVDASPENWTWFIAKLAPGEHDFGLVLSVPAPRGTIGVYLRGTAPAAHDAEIATDGPVFPVFEPERRPWSQTLQRSTVFGASEETTP